MNTLDKPSYSTVRKLLIFLTFAITYGVPNYAQYQFSPLAPQIMEQFGLNLSQFNSIFTAPMLPAIFTSIIIGLLVDRFGYKSVIGISILLTCLGTWIRVFAGNFPMMFVGMTLVGFSAGVLSSNASKVLAQLFGAEKVSIIMGFALSISTAGLVLSMSTTTKMGMPVAFIVAACIATVGLTMWFVFMPAIKPGQATQASAPGEDTAPPALSETLRVVLKNPYVWLVGVVLFCVSGAMAGTGSSVPAALQEARGLDADTAGLVGSLMMLGNLLGSMCTPTIALKTGKFRLTLMLCGALSALGCAFAWRAPVGIPLYLALIATGYAFGSGMSQMIAVAIRLPKVGPKYAGTAGGLAATLQLLGGVCIPTYIAAPLADLFGGSTPAGNYGAYFIVIGCTSVLWIVAMYLLPKSLDVKG